MKVCKNCLLEKPFDSFYKKSSNLDGYNSKCKTCERLYRKEHYAKNKSYYVDKAAKSKLKYLKEFHDFMKLQSCLDCGNDDFRVLEFDHLRDKSFNISDKAPCTPLKTLMKEIEKCDIVCANCHRIRTADRGNYYSY